MAGTVCDLYIDWHTGADGNAITTAIAAGSCRPTSPPNVPVPYPGSPLTMMRIEADSASPISGLVKCDGAEYDIGDTVQGTIYDHSANYNDFVMANVSAAPSVMSMGFLMKTTVNGDWAWHAHNGIFGAGDAEWVVLAPRYHEGAIHLYVHTSQGYSTGNIVIANNTWYWITMQYNRTAGCGYIAVYLASTMEQVGSTISLAFVASPPAVAYWAVGQVSQGGSTEATFTWDGPVIFDWTDGTFPLLPEAANVSYAALTGVSGTASLGALVLSLALALTGITGTGTVGDAPPAITMSASGVEATGETGRMLPFSAQAMTGVRCRAGDEISSAGSVVQSHAVALTGATGTGVPGHVDHFVAGDLVLPLTGVGVTASVGALTCGTATPTYINVTPRKRILDVRPRRRILDVFRRRS